MFQSPSCSSTRWDLAGCFFGFSLRLALVGWYISSGDSTTFELDITLVVAAIRSAI